jgi:hypothetical protein
MVQASLDREIGEPLIEPWEIPVAGVRRFRRRTRRGAACDIKALVLAAL